jgi:hypothetical protein
MCPSYQKVELKVVYFALIIRACSGSLVSLTVHSGGGGWSGRAKLSGGQESQTKGQGTVRLPPQWATTKAARQGARGPE